MGGEANGTLYLKALKVIADNIKDLRKYSQIKVTTIIELIAYGISKGKSTSHALDMLGRQDIVKDNLNVSRKMVCSDTHLQRLFAEKLNVPDSISAILFRFLKPYFPISKMKRIMILDGSGQGGGLFSFAALTTNFPFFTGLEGIEKRGKELNASRKLASRMLKLFNNDFDLFVADGLYVVFRDFRIVREKCPGKHLFVKTKEATLDIVQTTEAEYSIDKGCFAKDRSRFVKGFDEERNISYEIFLASAYYHKEVDGALYCYRVEETNNNTGTNEVFYCITTANDISLTEAREIAKKRWQIENNIFRIGNQSNHTKHRFFKNTFATINYLRLLFLILSLFFFLYYLKILHSDKKQHLRNFLLFAEYDVVLPAYQINSS